MKSYLSIFLLIAVLLAACAPQIVPQSGDQVNTVVTVEPTKPAVLEAQVVTGKTDKMGDAVILFEQSGGLAGKTRTWMVYLDGKVTSAAGETLNVDPAQIQAALADIQSLGYFTMKDSYNAGGTCNDCIQTTITVNYNGQTKTVKVVEGASETPANFGQIVDKIQSLTTGSIK